MSVTIECSTCGRFAVNAIPLNHLASLTLILQNLAKDLGMNLTNATIETVESAQVDTADGDELQRVRDKFDALPTTQTGQERSAWDS